MTGLLSVVRCYTIKGERYLHGVARLFAFAGIVLFAATEAQAAVDFAQIQRLIDAGAPGLAQEWLEQERPPYAEQPQRWISWERARIELLRDQKRWQELVDAPYHLPPGVPAEFRDWVVTNQVEALLALAEPAMARERLLREMWVEGRSGERRLQHWRQLLIRCYLQEDRVDDALITMQRYRQDYGDGEDHEVILRAEVLIRSGRSHDAVYQLESLSSNAQARALLLLAQLHSGSNARQVAREARTLLSRVRGDRAKQLLWAVNAEASAAAEDFAGEAMAVQHLLSTEYDQPLPSGLFKVDADRLWRAYRAYGRLIGNHEKLLSGDDQAWFAAAEQVSAEHPLRATALYALVSLEGRSASSRQRAHEALVKQLMAGRGGMPLVRQLYLQASEFADTSKIPTLVRRVLADDAIARGDLSAASRVLQSLEQAPDDADDFMWQLRRAKVFILAGDYTAGVATMEALVAKADRYNDEQQDQLMQLLFDLQTVRQHEDVLRLFSALLTKLPMGQLRREVLYWMGDSLVATEQHRVAARYYLFSATLLNPHAMDPWAQTARYQAARALVEGGLYHDAKNIYQQLLDVTEEPNRRAVLRRELEQLELQQRADEDARS